MSLRDRIPVDPLSDAQWERVERRVMERERAPASPAQAPPRRWAVWLLGGGLGAAVAAATVLFVMWQRAPAALPAPEVTRVSTLPGATPTLMRIGDAEIELGPATDATIAVDPRGGIVVELSRGRVECDVAPREARPPFAVVAGDVKVQVVGTHFSVERNPEVRVAVREGIVRVESQSGVLALGAGEMVTISGRNVVAGVVAKDSGNPGNGDGTGAGAGTGTGTGTGGAMGTGTETAAAKPRPRKGDLPNPRKLALTEAVELKKSSPEEAGKRLRQLSLGSDATAAAALYELAHLSLFKLRAPYAALAASREYLRRFPTGRDAADALWIRIEAHLDADDHAAAREAAEDYLRRYPGGAKAGRAREVADL